MTHITPDQWARIVHKARAARQARADYARLKRDGRRDDARTARRLALRLESEVRAAARV